jgi:hypothetical protein
LPDLDDEACAPDVDEVFSASHRLLERPEKVTERRPLHSKESEQELLSSDVPFSVGRFSMDFKGLLARLAIEL